MNSDNYSSSLIRQKKKDIIKMLRKEGIEPNEKQSKEELIKLLNLAKKANEPSRISNRKLIRAKGVRPFVLFLLTISIFVAVLALYKLNPTFNKNVNFLVSLMEVENQNSENPNEPTILEKNGKTYVVYNHPLVDVEVFYDESCKRPECEIDSYINKVKSGISPLVDVRLIDVNDSDFVSKTEKLEINMLPTFAFNKTVEKLGNYDQLKDNFISQKDNTYLLQFPPYRVLKTPEVDPAKLLYGDPNSETKIIAYLSFSSQQPVDTLPQLEAVSQAYGNAAVYLKYFYRNETDEKVALALECASQLDAFQPMLSQLSRNYANIGSSNVDRFRGLLNSYVANAGIGYTDFFTCYEEDNQAIIDNIAKSKIELNNYGIVGTPTILVNKNGEDSSGVIIGYYEQDNFMKLVDDILNQEFNSNIDADE